MSLSSSYNCTLKASYAGYVVQAIVNNFAPLLFLTFQDTFGISLGMITMLVTVNFGIQLLVDFLSARFVDRIGYRTCIVAAHVFAAAGLAGLAFIPDLMPGHFAGLVVCVCLYAVGGGIIEVLISPIVEACPTSKKDAAMSLLHSFYCWGAASVVLGSTLFFTVAGVGNWRILALLWAAVPAVNALVFARVPILSLVEDGDGMSIGELAGNRVFWLFPDAHVGGFSVSQVRGPDWLPHLYCGGPCLCGSGTGGTGLYPGSDARAFCGPCGMRLPVCGWGRYHRSADQPHCGGMPHQ